MTRTFADLLRQRPRSVAATLLVILVLWLFRGALTGGGVFYRRDIHLVWCAQVETFVRIVAQGSWPLWNPSLGFGRPLLADPSAQVLYPLTWLNLLVRPWTYYTVFATVHAMIATIGLFSLGRRLSLSIAGATVVTASSGMEALAALDRETFDAAILDIGLPEMDGYELLKAIRARPKHRQGSIPAAALTAYARVADRARSLQAGFQMHMSKPVQPSELAAAVVALAGPADE